MKGAPNRRTKDTAKAWWLKKTFQSRKQRATLQSRRRKQESGASSIRNHNTSECRAKQSLVAAIKASESYAYSDTGSELEKGNDRGKKIIDVEPNATVATTNIQKEELEDS